jgi:hypothetical protein
LKPRTKAEVVKDPDGHPILSDAEIARQAAPPAPPAEPPALATPACQIILTSAAPDAPWEWNVAGYSMFDAIAVTSLMLDQMKALAFQHIQQKANPVKQEQEKTDG